MPAFKYTPDSYETAPIGVHLAQVVKAEQTRAKSSGNEMLKLTLRTIPDGYFLNYFLVFNGKSDGLITQFCRHCEGELGFPGRSVHPLQPDRSGRASSLGFCRR